MVYFRIKKGVACTSRKLCCYCEATLTLLDLKDENVEPFDVCTGYVFCRERLLSGVKYGSVTMFTLLCVLALEGRNSANDLLEDLERHAYNMRMRNVSEINTCVFIHNIFKTAEHVFDNPAEYNFEDFFYYDNDLRDKTISNIMTACRIYLKTHLPPKNIEDNSSESP